MQSTQRCKDLILNIIWIQYTSLTLPICRSLLSFSLIAAVSLLFSIVGDIFELFRVDME